MMLRRYRFSHLSYIRSALSHSTKASLRTDSQGILSMQFMIANVDESKGPGFIEYAVSMWLVAFDAQLIRICDRFCRCVEMMNSRSDWSCRAVRRKDVALAQRQSWKQTRMFGLRPRNSELPLFIAGESAPQ